MRIYIAQRSREVTAPAASSGRRLEYTSASAWLDWDMTVTRRAASAFLMVAGVYQWTPLKHACLACQSPLAFIQKLGGFRGDPSGAVAVLAGFALLEKIAPIGPWFLRGVGAVLIVAALALIR